MYLSCLEIDTSSVRGRTWLASPYRIHQRLCLAFPDGAAGRILYRIEPDWRPPRIIVQSTEPADWERGFRDHPVLRSPAVQKEVNPRFHPGQRLRFILRANPTARRAAPSRPRRDDRRPMGPRVGLWREEDQRTWLARKGRLGGFQPLDFETSSVGSVRFRHGSGPDAAVQTHFGVDFQGHLLVTDPDALADTLAKGIGAGKAFGFGMLMLAPA